MGMFISDYLAHRVLYYSNWDNARSNYDYPADAVLGQDGFDSVEGSPNYRANRGGSTGTGTAASNTFNHPGYLAVNYTNTRLYVPDTDNNRIMVYNLPLTGATGDAADDSYCQGTTAPAKFTSTSASATASGCNAPTGVDSDIYGNLWIADRGNGRILLQCLATNTIFKVGGGYICDGTNNGGDFDLVLGKANLTSGYNINHCTNSSGQISASTMCRPTDVDYDPRLNRLVVLDGTDVADGTSDSIVGVSSGRIMIFDLSAPINNGAAATSIISGASGNENNKTVYDSRGRCSNNVNLRCGRWDNGDDGHRSQSMSDPFCVGDSDNTGLNIKCSTNTDCSNANNGTQCGCDANAFCDYSRLAEKYSSRLTLSST